MLSETYSGGTLTGLAVTNAYDAHLRLSAVALNTQTATLPINRPPPERGQLRPREPL